MLRRSGPWYRAPLLGVGGPAAPRPAPDSRASRPASVAGARTELNTCLAGEPSTSRAMDGSIFTSALEPGAVKDWLRGELPGS